jgi:hypothetical protein
LEAEEDKSEVLQQVDKLNKQQLQQQQLNLLKQLLKKLIMMLNCKNLMLQIRLN